MDLSPKRIELHANIRFNEIRGSRELRDNRATCWRLATRKVIHDSNLILIAKLCHQLSFVVYCSTDNHSHCLRGRRTHILRSVDEFIANRVPRYPRTYELFEFVFLIYYFIFL